MFSAWNFLCGTSGYRLELQIQPHGEGGLLFWGVLYAEETLDSLIMF